MTVKDLRARRGWTQQRLALIAGVHRATIVRAEHGEGVSLLNAQRIADAFGVERTDLFPESEAVAS